MTSNRRIRQKPHRLPREHYRGRVTVSFTACIEDDRPAFTVADIVATSRTFLATAAAKHGCTVPIYCFMPEHLHVIFQGVDDNADTWAAMVKFKQLTGYWFSRDGRSLRWQGDFHDHIIRVDEDFIAHVRYTAENPVRRGLVRQWSQYPFTGAIGFDLQRLLADIAADSSAQDSRRSP